MTSPPPLREGVRIAVIADVHGNLAALDAVLADAQDVDAHWFLGDLVAHGPRPAECVRRVRELPRLVAVRGNTDRYTLTQPPSSFDWTRAALSPDDLAWLGSLPHTDSSVSARCEFPVKPQTNRCSGGGRSGG